MGEVFLKKLFIGGHFFGQMYGVFAPHGGTNDQIMPRRRESFTNTLLNNQDILNLKNCPNPSSKAQTDHP